MVIEPFEAVVQCDTIGNGPNNYRGGSSDETSGSDCAIKPAGSY